MHPLRLHKLRYLLDQLDDNDFGIELCIQHLSGQAILNTPRPRWLSLSKPVMQYHLIGDRRQPWHINPRARLALHATLATGLIFPALLLFAR